MEFPAAADCLVRTGEQFGGTVRYTEADITAFATLVGDHNPMHHDRAHAAGSRFGRLIASGTQLVSRMMGIFASHFTRNDDGVAREALGVDFKIKFVAPVFAGEDITVHWTVRQREWKARSGGWLVICDGEALSPTRGVLLQMEGIGLVLPPRNVNEA